jgi:hypothetical protein
MTTVVDDPGQTGSDFEPGPVAGPGWQGFSRRDGGSFDMDDRRAMDVQRIQYSVKSNQYRVDCDKVAEAIVRRLMAGSTSTRRK